MISPETHKRYLDYRTQHGYFGRSEPMLSMAEFATLDREHRELDAKGEDQRDDDDEARFQELSRQLFRD